MARKLSRRDLAKYVASRLADGAPLKDTALQLAAHLIETRRTSELNILIREIADELAVKGHMSGTITAANELSEATVKAIEAYAKQKTGVEHLSLDQVVDESVLGGIKLELPGHELDATITRHLTILKTRYKKA